MSRNLVVSIKLAPNGDVLTAIGDAKNIINALRNESGFLELPGLGSITVRKDSNILDLHDVYLLLKANHYSTSKITKLESKDENNKDSKTRP